MTNAVKKKMVKMALKGGEIVVLEVAVPFIKDFATEKVYPTACEKWDELFAKKESKHHEKKVVKFEKKCAG